MAQESKLQQECDLEQKILTLISDSSIKIIQGGGKSYINKWCCVHFTKGKDSDHLTIQESKYVKLFWLFCALSIQTIIKYSYFINGSRQVRKKELKR